MKHWLIFTHPEDCLIGLPLSLASLWWDMWGERETGEKNRNERLKGEGKKEGEQCQDPWSSYRVYEAARGLVISPYPVLHPISLILSTSPWQTGSALDEKAKGYLLSFFPLSYPAALIPFVIYPASLLVNSQGLAVAARLLLPGLAAELPGLARTLHQFPQCQHLETLLMGLGTFANLSTSFGCGSFCQAARSGTWLKWMSAGQPFV